MAISLASLALAAGCGDDRSPRTGVGSAPGPGGLIVAALGDSITSGSPGYDPDPASRDAFGFGSDQRSSYPYWAKQANPGIDVRNCGVFGQRTDEIATRLSACAEGAGAIVIQGGINDIAQGLPAEAAAENIRGMIRAAKDLGLAVAITDVLPWNNGHPDADPAIRELNDRLATIATEEGIVLLRFHDTLENPTAPGRMKPEWTADGDHPSIAGYRRLGELAFKVPG